MFGYENREIVVVAVDSDPGGDQVFPIFRAPKDCELKKATIMMTDAVNADASNWVKCSLLNGGTAGTGTTAITDTVGGTAGWTALKPEEFTISEGTLEEDEVVCLKYDENGTVTPGVPIVVQLEVIYGVGADA